MLPSKLAFVDIETTGTSLRRDRVIEVGILRVEDNQVVKTFNSLINPDTHIPPEIFSLTGISPIELQKAPNFLQVKDEILEVLSDCVFVAHNVRFDYSFLKNEFKYFNHNFSPKQLCTVKLSRQLFPKYPHHNLDSLIQRHNFECSRRHRAFDDAHVLWQFYQLVQQKFPLEQIASIVDKLLKKPTLPIKISQEVLDNLPETPGVYVFYGSGGAPLYVGKSINIRQRVLSHFSSDHMSTKEMNIAQLVETIETYPTTGELGALIKESDMVKKMQPLYNRKLRLAQELVCLKKANIKGYETVSLETISFLSPAEMEEVLCIFKNKKQAKEFLVGISKEYELCEKLLGLEKGKGACFGYGLGRCKGACLGEEPAIKYNFRFINALAKHKLKAWPFTKPILIEEEDEFDNTFEGYLVDKWCYLGCIKQDGDATNVVLNQEIKFDLDIYKILTSFMKSEKNLKKLRQVDL